MKKYKKTLVTVVAMIILVIAAILADNAHQNIKNPGIVKNKTVQLTAYRDGQKPEKELKKKNEESSSDKIELKAKEKPKDSTQAKDEEKTEGTVKVNPGEKTDGKTTAKLEEKASVKTDKSVYEAQAENSETKYPKETNTAPGTKDESEKSYCTISVSCAEILNNMDKLNKDKRGIIPANGIILPAAKVEFSEGESVFDVTLREMQRAKIHFEFNKTPSYNSVYVEGINNIYEFDCGDMSGWLYKVNGKTASYGCSQYKLKDGDVISWEYTCNMGEDVGGSSVSGE
ncbi:MAG: DUF4430 domain-containing protein [Bacillota bacterium]|nr:DUF4430 domain-containing protein [Bacillota bacterium]